MNNRNLHIRCREAYSEYYGLQLLFVEQLFEECDVDEIIELNAKTFKKLDDCFLAQQIERYIQSVEHPESDPLY